MITQEQLDSFHQFASQRIANGGDATSLSGLVDIWMLKNPSQHARRANVAAIRDAIHEMEAGDRGRVAQVIVREVCEDAELNMGR